MQAEQAHENYKLTHRQYREQTRIQRFNKYGGGVEKGGKKQKQRGDFDNLNQ